jgi:hypothetical protein
MKVNVDYSLREVTTTFADGRTLVAQADHDGASRARADALGYGTDNDATWRMSLDHERLHALLAQAEGHEHSVALWYAAHPDQRMAPIDRILADREERVVLLMQRLLNTSIDTLVAELNEQQAA